MSQSKIKVLMPGIGDCLPFYVEGTEEEWLELMKKEKLIHYHVWKPDGTRGTLCDSSCIGSIEVTGFKQNVTCQLCLITLDNNIIELSVAGEKNTLRPTTV